MSGACLHRCHACGGLHRTTVYPGCAVLHSDPTIGRNHCGISPNLQRIPIHNDASHIALTSHTPRWRHGRVACESPLTQIDTDDAPDRMIDRLRFQVDAPLSRAAHWCGGRDQRAERIRRSDFTQASTDRATYGKKRFLLVPFLDGLAKSLISALRFSPRHCSVLIVRLFLRVLRALISYFLGSRPNYFSTNLSLLSRESR